MPAASAAVPVPGLLDSMGWPLDSTGPPASGAVPPGLDLMGAAGAVPHGLLPLPAALSPQRHAVPGAAEHRAGHARPSTPVSSRLSSRRLRRATVPSAAWPSRTARTARPVLPASAPVRLASGQSRQRDVAPRPGRSAPEPTSSVPPLSSPVTGGGPAASSAGSGGGAGAAVLLAGAAVLMIFLLSTRVSLDLAAWRSTLLSLRLERPG